MPIPCMESLRLFQDYLEQDKIPYRVQAGAWEILGDLRLARTQVSELPENLRVRGGMHIAGTPVLHLPERLHVEGSLNLSGTRIRHLPEHLHVQGSLILRNTLVAALPRTASIAGSLWLEHSAIQALPRGLRVQGTLELSGTPIAVLPDGLWVQEGLSLRGTRITRFPKDLHVGWSIHPPEGMQDIDAFMATQAEVVVLCLNTSHHQILRLRTQLQPFPDLWRILEQMGPQHRLRIQRMHGGKCFPNIERL